MLLKKGLGLKELSAVVASFLQVKVDIDNNTNCASIHYLLAVIYKELFVDVNVDIDIDIPEPKNKDQMATYTKRLANGSRKIQISGSLLLN